MDAKNRLIESVKESKVYQSYEQAFTEATGLPVALTSPENWNLPHRAKKNESPFCALMAQRSSACASCLRVQKKLRDAASLTAASVVCPAGLSDIAVPVRIGNELVGFLQTGQVFRKPPTDLQFERAFDSTQSLGLDVPREKLRKAYFDTTVITPQRHQSVVSLLSLFAQHLSLITNQILVQQKNEEPPVIARAREFIRANQAEDLSLGQVAKAVNCSTFYFCKLFKKFTGLNFTNYLSRLRTEKARELLMNPNMRISEVAFEVGFQSLTHFNRVFKNIVGRSPTEYRRHLARV